jgi:hypothetical protein
MMPPKIINYQRAEMVALACYDRSLDQKQQLSSISKAYCPVITRALRSDITIIRTVWCNVVQRNKDRAACV